MTNIKYDPELPFAVVRIKGDGEGYPEGVVEARTRLETDARDLAATYQAGWVKLVDTTPKPKIPEDAQFIYWDNKAGKTVAVRENYNPLKPWEVDGEYWAEDSLLELIGDAKVTVLVRKDET